MTKGLVKTVVNVLKRKKVDGKHATYQGERLSVIEKINRFLEEAETKLMNAGL